eukprot:TRINITY_DN34311_c0_g1_i1.p1 TRINITY_DN34311_c0_g1~~TRINITY_DN34311_c0_g1_i1.p1  ORF type:complete len:1373 (-),score=333.98 TRINITY_DN34311_c0_g1_i1:126-4199(-)
MMWSAVSAGRAVAVQPPSAPTQRVAGGAICTSGPSAVGGLWRRSLCTAGRLHPQGPWLHTRPSEALGWHGARMAAGLAAGVAFRTAARARKASSSTEILPADEIREFLKKLKEEEPVLETYLDTATDPWLTDYAELQPLVEGDVSDNPIGKLREWRTKGELSKVHYRHHKLTNGQFYCIVACDVHRCGFVTGTGLADTEEDAETLAAKQALERLFFPEKPIEEIKRCADAVRNHEHHSGARMPAIQAAETLEALEGKLEDVHVSAFRPCGKAWQAAISCMCFEVHVVGPAADDTQEVAMALAGEIFISRLRWYVRVPADDPHEPQMWAATWEQRKASRDKPWSGRTSVLSYEILRLSPLGGHMAGEDNIRKLLPHEVTWNSRRQALKDLTADRSSRSEDARRAADEAIKSGSAVTDDSERNFEVTSEKDDKRRKEVRGKLPVDQIRGKLAEALTKSQVVVVSGGTGSGKTTQLPQFIADDWRGDATSGPRVVVTEPRRIAAVSVAERVAWERNEKVGESVGFAVHGNSVRPSSDSGSMEFVTVGTLLRRAVDDPVLSKCDVVVVDEVHERDMLSDFLLVLLREVLPLRPDLRLVLMSATLDVESFTGYFNSCPILEVESGPLFDVEQVHLEDNFFQDFNHTNSLLNSEAQLRKQMSAAKEGASEEDSEDNDAVSVAGQMRWGGNDTGDSEKLLDTVDSAISQVVEDMSSKKSKGDKGAVLCFLPGWSEIRKLQDRLQSGPTAKSIWALPLHSTLPKEKQQQVFDKPPKNKIKVILGTNIAESSVTIGDVEVVVDSGLQRELTYDPKRRMSSLDTVWVSQSGAVQRQGRAGRVRAGRVLRLYSREQMEALSPQPSPEMQRCDLAQSCLQAVALGRDPRKFLADAIDPPSVAAVDAAMEQLAAIDAVGTLDRDASDKTPVLLPVGEVLARLPLEPLLGRAAMLGCMLGVSEPTAALLVASGGRSPFTGNKNDVIDAQKAFCSWSDALAAAYALLQWEDVAQRQGDAKAKSWAEKRCLSISRLSGLSRDKAYLLRDMQRAGLLRGSDEGKAATKKPEKITEADEGSGVLLETRGELEEAMLEIEQEDEADDAVKSSSWQVTPEIENLLTAVLCTAYPGNLAMQSKDKGNGFKLANFGSAVLSPASVNAGEAEKSQWWLYGDLQASGNRSYMHSTTILQDWQVALFGGLRYKESFDQKKGTCMVLDGWLQVGARMNKTNDLLVTLRRELREAFAWKALDALEGASGREEDESDTREATENTAALLHSVIEFLAGKDGAEKRAAPASKPKVEEDEGEEEEEPDEEEVADEQGEEEVAEDETSSADFDDMTMQQLKDLLRERGLKVSGRKAELIERLSGGGDD